MHRHQQLKCFLKEGLFFSYVEVKDTIPPFTSERMVECIRQNKQPSCGMRKPCSHLLIWEPERTRRKNDVLGQGYKSSQENILYKGITTNICLMPSEMPKKKALKTGPIAAGFDGSTICFWKKFNKVAPSDKPILRSRKGGRVRCIEGIRKSKYRRLCDVDWKYSSRAF